jgi:nucleoside-diphosphate-sugar epimerase
MKILITGVTGFIGKSLSKRVRRRIIRNGKVW